MRESFLHLIVQILGKSLMARHNLSGIAVGEKETGGQSTGKTALVMLVPQKLEANRLGKEMVPKKIVGLVDTDVVEVGDLRALHASDPKSRHRPVHAGISIGRDYWSGTLGAVIKARRDGLAKTLFLTNWHVAVGETGKVGDKIYQPGAADIVLTNAELIGKVYDFVPLTMATGGWWFFQPYNLADAALVSPIVISDMNYPNVGALTGTVPATIGLEVQKYGRTTQWTTGRVKYVNATVTIGYDNGNAVFRKQIISDIRSGPGDSGSLIVSGRKAAALLFAGSDKVTIGTPIQIVLDRLFLSNVSFTL